ncbi:toxin-antitoxin system protein [Enterocloster bolteae]|uniref:toxin-antitoxin system protein n=1 Tax=Enterocloster bolteae TaxID=208479 RepID=UPI0018A0EF57|nr:toxin-antitoxin system protein [Enterocloster bolteae]
MKNPKRRRRGYLRRWLRAGVYAGGYCECCNQPLVLIFRYDAVCCPQCNQWIDEKCGDPDCCFCGSRPDTPAESLIYECPPIGKDYYIKKYEKRKRQYFKGMGDRGPAGWNRRPSHPLPVKKGTCES